MRHTRAHSKNRRSHHGLKTQKGQDCPKCGSFVVPHRICATCGTYKGNQVVDVMAKLNKKEKKAKEAELKTKEKEQRSGKPLDAVSLSNK